MTETLDAIAREIEARFVSGNSTPVERTHITRAEWDAIRAALSNQGDRNPTERPIGFTSHLYLSELTKGRDASVWPGKSLRDNIPVYLHPAEADRRDADAFYAACQRAAAELPYDWEIRICLENGAGTVELCAPDGEVTHMEVDADDRLTAEINAAIDAATQEQT